MSFGPQRAKVLGYLSVQLVSEISNVCDPDPKTSQTDGQTDRRTTCDRNTALCTKVHRAGKTSQNKQEGQLPQRNSA